MKVDKSSPTREANAANALSISLGLTTRQRHRIEVPMPLHPSACSGPRTGAWLEAEELPMSGVAFSRWWWEVPGNYPALLPLRWENSGM